MLSLLSSSLPSPTTSALSRPMHLNSFVVLTKKSSSRRLARRRSVASLASTASSSSDDESDNGSDLDADDCCVAYESYAAVATRSHQPAAARELRWSDLQRSQSSAETSSLLAALRQKRRHSRDGEALELAALELCFEFLTLEELQAATLVCRGFYEVAAHSEMLLSGLYTRQWRRDAKMLPVAYVTLPYSDQLALCAGRRVAAAYELSTRSAVTHLPSGEYQVMNNSMLRNFEKGAVDSVRGLKKLPLLSCARALHKRISYYEVSMKGCGSVGLASLSDASARNAYGFGSGEHVGWKGVSYGYHGNDGDFVYNDGAKPYGGAWEAFGPSWGRAEARSGNQEEEEEALTFNVGCGLDADKHQVFFTLNGELLGMAPATVLPGDYAAAVSLHAFNDEAVVNVGAAPFLFDIEGFCASL